MTDAEPEASGRVVMSGSGLPVRPSFQMRDRADADEAVRVVVKLRPKAEPPDPLRRRAQFPSERRSAPSREDYGSRYGADAADVEAMIAFAGRYELRVERRDESARLVVLTGAVRDVEKAFGTTLYAFESPTTSESYRGHVGDISIPADLRGRVTTVAGLDTRVQVRPREAPAQPLAARPPWRAAQLAALYSFPPGLDGSGQTIGILAFGGGYREADLDGYFSGGPRPIVTGVSVDGTQNHPGLAFRPDNEVTLDVEVAGGAAPGARIVVYFAQNTAAGWQEALATAVHDTSNRPSVISISWGYREFERHSLAWTAENMNDINGVLRDAANLDVTVVVASGDLGSNHGRDDNQPHVDFPASSPYVLACGGTTLVTSEDRISGEAVWNTLNPSSNGNGASGGGYSDYFPRPAWQHTVAPVPADASFAGRGIPDVAAVADHVHRIVVGGVAEVIGGTSAAAPLWAGLIARINQRLAQLPGGRSAGYLNPLLYQTLGWTKAFPRDIDKGSNDADLPPIGRYLARRGWDPCTGWGSPDGTSLLRVLERSGLRILTTRAHSAVRARIARVMRHLL